MDIIGKSQAYSELTLCSLLFWAYSIAHRRQKKTYLHERFEGDMMTTKLHSFKRFLP
jgi:hypothetical protein